MQFGRRFKNGPASPQVTGFFQARSTRLRRRHIAESIKIIIVINSYNGFLLLFLILYNQTYQETVTVRVFGEPRFTARMIGFSQPR